MPFSSLRSQATGMSSFNLPTTGYMSESAPSSVSSSIKWGEAPISPSSQGSDVEYGLWLRALESERLEKNFHLHEPQFFHL